MRWIDRNYDTAILTPNGRDENGWPVDDLNAQVECRVCDEPLGYNVPVFYAEGRPIRHASCSD